MKKFSFLILVFIGFSAIAQEPLIIEKKKINWEDFPTLYSNYEEGLFKKGVSFLEGIDMYEITYMSDGLKIQAYAAMPEAEGKYPVIVVNRGGNRDFNHLTLFDRRNFNYPTAIAFPPMAQEGYIVIGCNYRGSGKSEGMEEYGGADVNDVLNLIEALDEIPEADTERIGMYGWSRGAMMTYLAMAKSDKIKAVVVGAGDSDLRILDRSDMETGVYAELIPNYWENKEEELKKRSAVLFADQFKKDVPILMLHGNSDWRVNVSHSLNLALQLDKFRVPYRLKIYEGGDHSLSTFREDRNRETMSWFERYLKNDEALPNMEHHGS